MAIEIPSLTPLTSKDMDRITRLFLAAFHDYPKLKMPFPEEEKRQAALEALIRFYGTYDLKYGRGYALNEDMDAAVLIVESAQLNYSSFRHLMAGSYSKKYREAMKRLGKKERKRLRYLFAELEELEKDLTFPEPHLYVDFIGVWPDLQGRGRGYELMNHICDYADTQHLPIMLFTNTEEDIRFYRRLGFEVVGQTHSKKYGFTNQYMVREAGK